MSRKQILQDWFIDHQESVKYVKRLTAEWVKHGRIIIGCDIDDTIHPWSMQHNEYDRTIHIIKEAQKLGALVVINTASDINQRKDFIKKLGEETGIRIDAINENPIELPYGKWGKIYANIYLDDRAGLNEALKILEFATIMTADELAEKKTKITEATQAKLNQLSIDFKPKNCSVLLNLESDSSAEQVATSYIKLIEDLKTLIESGHDPVVAKSLGISKIERWETINGETVHTNIEL